MRRMPNLRFLAHLAGSVRPVITPEIMATGLRVSSAAAANARPVADFTLAHVLLHLKRVEDWARLYRQRRSAIAPRADALRTRVGNRDRTVGIVGASRIGRIVIGHLHRHGIRVLLHDPYVSPEAAAALGVERCDMARLLATSDVVSLHQPLNAETAGTFGAREFAAMRDGALLINTARGGIVRNDALVDAMRDGRLSAVLDVSDPEALDDDSPLWDMPNVRLTPHIAGSFGREVADMTDLMLSEIERFARGEPLLHEVTLANWERMA